MPDIEDIWDDEEDLAQFRIPREYRGLPHQPSTVTRTDPTPPAADYVAGLLPVPMDDVINDLGWKMADWLSKNGAQYDGRVFNHMKGFLATVIDEWVRSRPAARPASPDVAQDVQTRVVTVEEAAQVLFDWWNQDTPEVRQIASEVRKVMRVVAGLKGNEGMPFDQVNFILERIIIGGQDRG